MSLEEALLSTTAALNRNSDLLERVVGAAAAKTASKAVSTEEGEAEEKPKRGRKSAAEKETAKEPAKLSAADVVSNWLNEIQVDLDDDDEPVDDEDNLARAAKRKKRANFVKRVLKELLKVEKVADIADEKTEAKLIKHIEAKKEDPSYDPFDD